MTIISKECELTRLRKRVKNQRSELRRFNKRDEAFWCGWHYYMHVDQSLKYRSKMIDAFGVNAVIAAEKNI